MSSFLMTFRLDWRNASNGVLPRGIHDTIPLVVNNVNTFSPDVEPSILAPLSSSVTTPDADSIFSDPLARISMLYFRLRTERLPFEHRDIVKRKWKVWAHDPVRQRKVVDILCKWYTDKARPKDTELMTFYRELYRVSSSLNSSTAAVIAPYVSSHSTNVGGYREERARTETFVGYECLWPDSACSESLKFKADRIQEDALLHLGIKVHICSPW
jgi:hypothetical protein